MIGHWNWIASRPVRSTGPWKKNMKEKFVMNCWLISSLPSRAAIHFSLSTAICNRAATEISVLPRTKIVRRGLEQEPQQAQKPPAFRKGKQVVLSIWVPGGIACKVTIYTTVLGIKHHFNHNFIVSLADCQSRWGFSSTRLSIGRVDRICSSRSCRSARHWV